jgi:sterol 3beta-glucosyltransferase
MKAVIFGLGTRGDIEPFLAIAEVLKSYDWEVLCVFPEQYREMTEDMGLNFRGFSKEYLEMTFGNKESKEYMSGRSKISYFLKMRKRMKQISSDIKKLQHEIQLTENPDRVIYPPKLAFSFIYGMQHPGKTVLICPSPGVSHPVKNLTALGDMGKFNGLINGLINTLRIRGIQKIYKQYKDLYPGIKSSYSSIRKTLFEKEKTIYTISPSLFEKPEYWPETAHVPGFYERNRTHNWQPDGALLQFLESHEKIVFISFGSMINNNSIETTRIIVDVLKRNNIAAILGNNWGGLEEMEHPKYIFFVKEIPHEWIFPKIYAVVHHGGSGTTHMGLKYGCPTLIIPHIQDQFLWNQTIASRELGPKGVSIKKLSDEVFEPLLLDLMNNATYLENARQVSEQMKSESDKERLLNLIAS